LSRRTRKSPKRRKNQNSNSAWKNTCASNNIINRRERSKSGHCKVPEEVKQGPASKCDNKHPYPCGYTLGGLASVNEERLLVALAICIDHDGDDPINNSVFGYPFHIDCRPIAYNERNNADPLFTRGVFPHNLQGMGSINQFLGIQFEVYRRY